MTNLQPFSKRGKTGRFFKHHRNFLYYNNERNYQNTQKIYTTV